MPRRNALLLALLGLMLVVPPVLTAQNDGQPGNLPGGSPDEKTADQPRRPPLPTYYGMLGVTDEQRTELNAVRDSYEDRLKVLRQQLKALVDERDAKMESLLTDGQKLRLKELRAEAAKRAAEKLSSDKPADPGASQPGEGSESNR